MADAAIHNVYQQFAITAERFPDRIAVELQRRNSLECITYWELRGRADAALLEAALWKNILQELLDKISGLS